ncbi:chromatin assembly factor 1 subunit A-domain-containing protein [Daedaleopsis nitida]|nr:chromatin assembly factor 1 subunit A-domain-containing protein [Daedaleopsis nitida]
MSETLQEIVKFREMLEERLSSRLPPMTAVPDEHKPVIAKLVHESDKTLQALSKHVQQQLLPEVDEYEDDNSDIRAMLPLDTVENAIKSVAKRVNYGLDSTGEGGKVPASWLVWRWELSDVCRDWLPKTAKEKADNRLRERQQAKQDVKTLFESLPDHERVAILGTNKTPAKVKHAKGVPGSSTINLRQTTSTPPGATVIDLSKDEPVTLAQNKVIMESATPETNAGETPDKRSVGRPKRPMDPEKAAKVCFVQEKERQEKKAAKVEREKKVEAAQAKSRSIMANFFGKAKGSASASPAKGRDGETGSPGPTSAQSDFQRTFRPFAIKKDTVLAPQNWFRERSSREKRQRKAASRTTRNVIVIDDDEDATELEDVIMEDAQDLDSMAPRDRLRDILTRLPAGPNPSRRPLQPTGYKTYNPLSVRGLMSQLTEAEVAGDDTEVRRLLAILRNRQALPAKAFMFHEDARPGYFGTFTRNSREIGPRSPFARDAVQVDYTYDSGEEWAEEDAGDADDVVEDGDEDGDGDEEQDSDMDSWLVDDDEVEDPGTPIEERLGSPNFPDIDLLPLGSGNGKRKAKEEKEKSSGGKKRRVVIPLVPFVKGPEWELSVGRCAYEPFKAYRIQLFNDTSHPIDPFRFVSQPVEQQIHASGSGQSHSHTADGFAIPALPPHLTKSSSHPSALTPSSSTSSDASPAPIAKRPAPAPRNPFPEAHLPHLLARINELATSSLQGIVETVHRELQAHKVKKNAIEAKVREVGEKCKEKKVWVVKPSMRVSGCFC